MEGAPLPIWSPLFTDKNTMKSLDLTGYNRPLKRVQSLIKEGTMGSLSEKAKKRMSGHRFEPLFLADWDDAMFLHFAINSEFLRPHVPFRLDTIDGKAFVSLVAFTMRNMRFHRGGDLTRWLTWPIANHSFLNLRTYVKAGGESGIHFISEWLNHPIATKLGPVSFGLPYRFGELDYRVDHEGGEYSAEISAKGKRFNLQQRRSAAKCFDLAQLDPLTNSFLNDTPPLPEECSPATSASGTSRGRSGNSPVSR